MPQSKDRALSDALRRFDPMATLSESQLGRIADEVQLLRAARGTRLLDIGSRDPRLLFLMDGELELVAEDGARHRVRHSDAAALGPVSRLRPSRYRVTALTEIRYLWVDRELLEQCCRDASVPGMLVEETLITSSPNDLIDSSATHALMFDVLNDINQGRIIVPSDPDIAIRVGRALDARGTNVFAIAQILSICPSLTLKAIRAARAADPVRAPVYSCKRAVTRLGIDRVYELTAHCVLRESLRTASYQVQRRMRRWWRRTIRVSAISQVLASMSERFDPDYAALIGLLHNIAEPVMLQYADRHADLQDSTLLDNVLHDNRAELGRILLSYWDMPRTVIDAAAMSNNWGYSHPGEADYVDINLVAQWHAAIGDERSHKMPRLEKVPAAEKLGLTEPSPKMSLKIVETAESAVEKADALLGV